MATDDDVLDTTQKEESYERLFVWTKGDVSISTKLDQILVRWKQSAILYNLFHLLIDTWLPIHERAKAFL